MWWWAWGWGGADFSGTPVGNAATAALQEFQWIRPLTDERNKYSHEVVKDWNQLERETLETLFVPVSFPSVLLLLLSFVCFCGGVSVCSHIFPSLSCVLVCSGVCVCACV